MAAAAGLGAAAFATVAAVAVESNTSRSAPAATSSALELRTPVLVRDPVALTRSHFRPLLVPRPVHMSSPGGHRPGSDTRGAPAGPKFALGVWDRVAACESSGNWHDDTGNGYYGGLQEDLIFWSDYGGRAFAARPDLATRDQQIEVARRGLAVQGPGAWPVCGPRAGLARGD